jgi:uncharacterized damage-inducible protein DinB
MDSQQAKAIADFLVADFEREIPTTVNVLKAVPAAGQNYSPDQKSKSAIALVRHITMVDEWFLHCIADGGFTRHVDDSEKCGLADGAAAAAHYQAKVPEALGRFKAMSGDELAKVIDFFGVMQLPRVNIMATAIKHSVHHRGQLSAYLRSMGAKVPGIYGPSGDSQ